MTKKLISVIPKIKLKNKSILQSAKINEMKLQNSTIMVKNGKSIKKIISNLASNFKYRLWKIRFIFLKVQSNPPWT